MNGKQRLTTGVAGERTFRKDRLSHQCEKSYIKHSRRPSRININRKLRSVTAIYNKKLRYREEHSASVVLTLVYFMTLLGRDSAHG